MDVDDAPDTLSALQEAVAHGDDRRSPLFRWMMQNYDQFAGILQSARLAGSRPNWLRLSETFARHGLCNLDGDPLKKHTVRTTWWRVRKTRANLLKHGVLAPAPPASEALKPVARPAVTQPSSQAPHRPQESPVRVRDSNEALADMLAEMNRRSGRI